MTTCRIQKGGVIVGEIGQNEIFGEMSFLEGQAASATVISVEPVELYVIEGFTIKRLLQSHPDLGARFFKYVASVLEERLTQRERKLYKPQEQ